RALRLGQISWSRLISQTGVVVAVWLLVYGSLRLLFGFDLVRVFGQIGSAAIGFNESVGRRYSIWIWGNLWEFLFGVGICQAILLRASRVPRISGTRSVSCTPRSSAPRAACCRSASAAATVSACGVPTARSG